MDAAITFENDHLIKMLPKAITLKKMEVLTMRNLNEYIATALKQIMLPQHGQKGSLFDISFLTSVPQFKLLTMATNPFLFNSNLSSSSVQWSSLIDGCY